MSRTKIRKLALFPALAMVAFVTVNAGSGPEPDEEALVLDVVGLEVTTTSTTTVAPATTTTSTSTSTTTLAPTTTVVPTTTTALPSTTAAPTSSAAPETTAGPATTQAPATTVGPPPTTTEAPQTVTAADIPGSTIAVGEAGRGVVVSPTGIPLPIMGGEAGAWIVRTPCGNEATIGVGQTVDRVDIVLDPGHGGVEPGAVGEHADHEVLEKELNLDISLRVADHLRADGYTVVLTRQSDIRVPLVSRAEMARALRPKAFVSIHHNGGGVVSSSTPGTEVYYQASSAEARRLGGLLYEEIFAAMSQFSADFVATSKQGVSTRLNEDGDDLYGIHRFTPDVPSVITEALYVSNPAEAALLERDDVRAAEARAIATGILRFLRTDDAGSGYNEPFVDPGSSGTGGFSDCTDPALT